MYCSHNFPVLYCWAIFFVFSYSFLIPNNTNSPWCFQATISFEPLCLKRYSLESLSDFCYNQPGLSISIWAMIGLAVKTMLLLWATSVWYKFGNDTYSFYTPDEQHGLSLHTSLCLQVKNPYMNVTSVNYYIFCITFVLIHLLHKTFYFKVLLTTLVEKKLYFDSVSMMSPRV